MEKKQKFIKTTDEHTAKILRDAGYIELAKEGSHFVFINDYDKTTFSSDDGKKVYYTNKLTF